MKKSLMKAIMNQRVNPELRRLTLLPRQTGKTASVKCPKCGSVDVKYINAQVRYWCTHCGYQGDLGKSTVVPVSDQPRFAVLTCPKCGQEDLRDLEVASICLCANCGFEGQLIVQDAPVCKLDDAELYSDQAVLNDVLTWKKK